MFPLTDTSVPPLRGGRRFSMHRAAALRGILRNPCQCAAISLFRVDGGAGGHSSLPWAWEGKCPRPGLEVELGCNGDRRIPMHHYRQVPCEENEPGQLGHGLGRVMHDHAAREMQPPANPAERQESDA